MCSAFISGAEVAYFSLNASELDDLAKEKKSSVILKLLKKPNQLLATILIANMLLAQDAWGNISVATPDNPHTYLHLMSIKIQFKYASINPI